MTKGSFILGIGGTTRPGSTSERILREALSRVEAAGFATECLAGPDLILPMYDPGATIQSDMGSKLVQRMRACSGIIISSPGYHGTVSGMIKNALDYAEDLAGDERPYFEGKPVGCIACAYGWQAAGSTLATLRSISHALRGWPTPLGIIVNSSAAREDARDGSNEAITANLDILARQIREKLT